METGIAVVFGVALGLGAAGCHGAGPYGHAPRYAERGDEPAAIGPAREYDGAGVQRQPDEWRKGLVRLFGVVQSRAAGPNGQALLKLGVRALEPQNACAKADDDSCRVAVSDKDYGVVWALVSLHGDDDTGPVSVGQRSLVRVVGTVGQDVSPSDGAPIVHASWYRQWPPSEYVSRASDARAAGPSPATPGR